MNTGKSLAISALVSLLVACSDEPEPRTVSEFVENPLLMEAALVRCAQNRSESRYETECVNARQAVEIVEAREEKQRAEAREAQSQRKREALRRTQQAAAEARRRAREAEERRREAEYLSQFGETLEPGTPIPTGDESQVGGNVPVAELPAEPAPDSPVTPSDVRAAGVAPDESETARDLNAIREELQRRNEAADTAD